MRRLLTLGCGGLVALVVLIVGLTALMGGGEDTNTQDPGAANNPDEAEQAQEKPAAPAAAPIGEKVPVGDVAWQVTNARQATELSSAFGESKQGNFVIVDFLFENNAKEAVTLDSSSLSLLDGEGRESQVDTDNFMFIDPAKDVFLQQVNPGVSREGEVIYTVAPGASDFTLSVGDTNMFGGEEASIDLGF